VIAWTVPVRVKGPNAREHWKARARRVKSERSAVWGSCLVEVGALGVSGLRAIPRPLVVTLTRVGARMMDDDNVQGSLKAVRDEVANLLGEDDGPAAPVRWRYGQELGEYGVRVEVCSAANGAA
jgi:hypothetical protein